MIQLTKRTIQAFKTVFADPLFLFLAVSLGVNLLVLYYLIFLHTTTLEVFFASNTSFYNWSFLGLTAANAALFGVALSMVAYILKRRRFKVGVAAGNSTLGAVLGAISSGCPVCGAWLLPLLGIAGSLAAFPLQGLEIKALSIFLLLFSIHESTKSILGICEASKENLFYWDKNHLNLGLNLNRNTLSQVKGVAFGLITILLLYGLPRLPQAYKINFANKNAPLITSAKNAPAENNKIDTQSLFDQVNPPQGYTLKANYDDLGPKILQSGAIDLEKFKSIYEQAGSPLTNEQLTILTKGLNKSVTINQETAYFLINFFWALGLANKNPLLTEGPIAQYGQGQIGSFASTGGWSIAKKDLMDFYSKTEIIKLTPAQQVKVEEAAANTYRPCCGNPTSFPDCNHGLALLAVLELLASKDSSLDEMYEAAKYFNAFWFPQQYLDLAAYFKANDGKDFKDVAAKQIVSAEFSSGQGWSKTKQWLDSNNLVEKAPSGGGGCGV